MCKRWKDKERWRRLKDLWVGGILEVWNGKGVLIVLVLNKMGRRLEGVVVLLMEWDW